MPRCYGAEDCVARTRPETVLLRREIPVVFAKNDGGSVGNGFAHGVVGKVAAVALSVCTPTLPPFFGAVLPLANARAHSLCHKRDRPCRADHIQLKAFFFGQLTRFSRTHYAQHFVDDVLMLRGSGGSRLESESGRPRQPDERD